MQSKTTVGIITMHRPISFGSSLQAYALQHKIEALGHKAEIIDYKYPNMLHYKQGRLRRWLINFVRFMMNMPLGFPNVVEQCRFSRFRNRYMRLSPYYKSSESLSNNPPTYDVYCTGSDQVWNSKFTKSDTTFLLSFAPATSKKISYASSFAIDYVIDEYKSDYVRFLSQYTHISVRESSGIHLVKSLVGKSAELVCDPTLLLTKEEWYPLVQQSKIKINKPYILVFMLSYSFDPYPEVANIINRVNKDLGYHLVFLSGRKQDYFHKDATVIKSAGPCEFLHLLWNASFIITSSFHGVAFSVNFEKDFIAIVKKGNSDSRLISFLKKINMEDRAMPYDSKDEITYKTHYTHTKLSHFREESIDYLKNSLM